MFVAAEFCCAMITPLKADRAMKIWVERVLEDLRYQRGWHGLDSPAMSDSDLARTGVFSLALCRGINIFTQLDGGPAPSNEVTDAQKKEYFDLLRRHDLDLKAYQKAQEQLKTWIDVYGDIPAEPEQSDDFQVLTQPGEEHLAKKARNDKLLAEAVCLGCHDPSCSCNNAAAAFAAAAVAVKTE